LIVKVRKERVGRPVWEDEDTVRKKLSWL